MRYTVDQWVLDEKKLNRDFKDPPEYYEISTTEPLIKHYEGPVYQNYR